MNIENKLRVTRGGEGGREREIGRLGLTNILV